MDSLISTNHQSHEQEDHLRPAKHLVGSFADAVPGLPVPRLPGPGGDKDDDVDVVDDEMMMMMMVVLTMVYQRSLW